MILGTLTPRSSGSRPLHPDAEPGLLRQLWIASREGGDPARLTRNHRIDFVAAGSPDGRAIVFIARGSVGTWDVWTIAADGSNERRLTEQGGG